MRVRVQCGCICLADDERERRFVSNDSDTHQGGESAESDTREVEFRERIALLTGARFSETG